MIVQVQWIKEAPFFFLKKNAESFDKTWKTLKISVRRGKARREEREEENKGTMSNKEESAAFSAETLGTPYNLKNFIIVMTVLALLAAVVMIFVPAFVFVGIRDINKFLRE